MPKSSANDRTFLELKSGKWRVTIAVPRRLHSKLGTRLKQSLGTDSLAMANRLKWVVIAELKARIEQASGDADPLLKEALEVARMRRRARSDDLEGIDYAIEVRAEQIAGPPLSVVKDHDGEEQTYEASRERAALRYAQMAKGAAIPVDLHYPDYLRQLKAVLTRRTVADDERALRHLRQWCGTADVPFMLHEITRREASNFMDEMKTVTGATSPVTHIKYLTRLSRYWRWMVERDIASVNPWIALRPAIRPTPHNEKERPFTNDEVSKLLAGATTPAMHDLMRIAALSGARLDAIVDLKVADCETAMFLFKPQKRERGPRRIPIHSALLDIVKRRCEGRLADAPLFPEWPPPSNKASQRERSFKASNAFTAYRRSVGVDERIEGKRRSLVNFHSFRRWFITKAEQSGQPESTIAWIVGHRRPGMTLGLYSAGPGPAQLSACIEAISLPCGAGDRKLRETAQEVHNV